MGSPGASGPRAARDRFKLKKKAGSSSSFNSRAFDQVEPSSDGSMYPAAFDAEKLSLDDNGGWRTKMKEDPGSSMSSSSSSARKSSSSSSSSSSSNSSSNPYRSKSDQPQFDFGPTAAPFQQRSSAPVSVKVTFELKLFAADKVGLYMKPIKATTVELGDKMAALVKQVQGHSWQSLDNWQPGSVKDGANGGGGPDGAVGVWCVPISAHDAISSRLYTLGGPLVDITVKKVDKTMVEFMKKGSKRWKNIEAGTTGATAFGEDSKIPKRLQGALFQFQREGVDFVIQQNGRAMIGDEMGLGKTVQAIAVSCHYSDDWPVLVICPSSLRLNWQDEFMRWVPGMGKHRVHVILKGKDGVFPNEMRRSTDVVIVSYDLVTKLLADLQKAKFGVIICDESHFLKNHKAKRTEACLSLLQPAKYIVMLTGTPALSRPIELHTQVEALRPGLLGSRTDYGIKFCGARKARFGGMEYKGATHMGELHMLLKQYCMIRRKKEDVLTQLPDKTRGAVVLETGSRACKKIAEMIKDVKKQKGGANDEDELSMLQNQEQGLMAEAYKETGLAKIEPVQAYITDLIEGGAKFLIFAHHGAVLDAIETAVQKCKVDYFRLDGKTPMKQRQADVNRFQQNETCRVAVLSITAGGTGLTLTAASMVVFAELYWTPAQMLQAEDRVHRIGQANAVTITYLLGKDTLDDVIWPMINSKLQVLGSVLDDQKSGMEMDTVDGDRQSAMLRQTKMRTRKPKPSTTASDGQGLAGAAPPPSPAQAECAASSQQAGRMWGDSGDEGEKDAGEDVGEPGKGEWTCSTCTLLNPQSLSACQVCETARPPEPARERKRRAASSSTMSYREEAGDESEMGHVGSEEEEPRRKLKRLKRATPPPMVPPPKVPLPSDRRKSASVVSSDDAGSESESDEGWRSGATKATKKKPIAAQPSLKEILSARNSSNTGGKAKIEGAKVIGDGSMGKKKVYKKGGAPKNTLSSWLTKSRTG